MNALSINVESKKVRVGEFSKQVTALLRAKDSQQ